MNWTHWVLAIACWVSAFVGCAISMPLAIRASQRRRGWLREACFLIVVAGWIYALVMAAAGIALVRGG
jgi:hypothetical protein